MITYTKSDLEKVLYNFACFLTGYNQSNPAIHDGQFIPQRRFYGNDHPQHAITMIGINRLLNLGHLLFDVVENKVPGDFIETGVWRGGACIFTTAFFELLKITDRNVYVADSFAGLPKPDPKYPVDAGDQHYLHSQLIVSLEEVQQNFKTFGLLNDQVKFIKGWFCDTLPTLNTKFAIIRLDGDMYGSTMDGLNNLYNKLSIGGYVIIDDYGLPGAKAATNDFRNQHNISSELIQIDQFSKAVYWKKTS
jgi:O-methyltransferase